MYDIKIDKSQCIAVLNEKNATAATVQDSWNNAFGEFRVRGGKYANDQL